MNKHDLIQKVKALDGISQDERAYLIDLINTKKKYGLVWEDKPEDVEETLRQHLPVLQEVVEKRIISEPRLTAVKGEQDAENTKPQQTLLFDEVGEETNPTNQNNPDNHSSDNVAVNHTLIEGDNLHAITALTFTHENKIDVIYIDPPYNTGNKDFKYNDSFVDKEDSYRHSKWLSFMDKRLRIAKRLLSDKGVIFISIDDNEQAQLKLLCDEVFGEVNRIEKFVWRTDGNFDNQAQIKNCHEYILCYSKSATTFKVNSVLDPNVSETSKLFNSEIQNTIIKNGPKNPISSVKIPIGFPTLFENGEIKSRFDKYPFYHNTVYIDDYKTQNEIIVESGWASKKQLENFIKGSFKPIKDTKGQETIFKISHTGSIEVIKVRDNQSHIISVLTNLGNTQSTSNSLKDMGINFSFPKPVKLIQYIIDIVSQKNSIILDFFAGSGTTLHATMELNKDGGSRQCILVTNNENNICEEVTYERNKRVIEGYTNAKGAWVEGLSGNNLRYYKTATAEREPSLRNKRQLTRLATELLCIKEDCYTPRATTDTALQAFEEKTKRLLLVYDDAMIDEALEYLKSWLSETTIESPIKVYVFSNGQYPYTEDFEEVLPHITLCALPDAIYKAYQYVLPKRVAPVRVELEEDSIDED